MSGALLIFREDQQCGIQRKAQTLYVSENCIVRKRGARRSGILILDDVAVSDSLQELIPLVLQVGEVSGIDETQLHFGCHSESFEFLSLKVRADQNLPVVCEADQELVEKRVKVRGKEEPVIAVQPLIPRLTVFPGLRMTCPEALQAPQHRSRRSGLPRSLQDGCDKAADRTVRS